MLAAALFTLVLTQLAPTPAPSPSSRPDLKEIGAITTRGRIDRLIGSAASASEGFVGHDELEKRPILRPGELIESVPGVVISQHSGEGKANQYYLRGFNLDHGTDIAITVGGIPANLRTHAHGQGYSDINWVIPEVVNYVNYHKGPYTAADGDFSTAGSVTMAYYNVLPHDIASVSGGPYGHARTLLAGSPALGANGQLLYALEYQHENNTADDPDNFRKYNGLLRYSRHTNSSLWGVTAQAYQAQWNASDQIPLRAVQRGEIDRFGQIDPTDGGRTHRYALSTDYFQQRANQSTQFNAYVLHYQLRLFSDFTYFLNDPGTMDQFHQADDRVVTGLNLSHTWKTPSATITLGYQLRNDNIAPVALYATKAQHILSTTRIDRVVETSHALFAQTEQRFSKKLRVTAGVRADLYDFKVGDLRPENSGKVHAALISPKLGIAFAANSRTELYVNVGESFHSNDARGITQTVDSATPLVRAIGQEIGARFALGQKLRTTVSLWNLDLGSELVFAGDAGTTSPSRPSNRYGIEVANFWQPVPWLSYDLDYSSSAARFTNFDPVGSLVPGSIKDVVTFGLTADRPKVYGSIRLRYFGPRPLVEDGGAHSNPTTTLSLQAGFKPGKDMKIGVDFFNLLNAQASDIDYFYTSSIPSDPAYTKPGFAGACPIAPCGVGVADVHFHPIERRLFRVTFSKQF